MGEPDEENKRVNAEATVRDSELRPTHTGRDEAMRRDFLLFKSRKICSLESFIESFITFQQL